MQLIVGAVSAIFVSGSLTDSAATVTDIRANGQVCGRNNIMAREVIGYNLNYLKEIMSF